MAVEPPPTPGGRSLVREGKMQSDLDANYHKILHLDTSNLVLDPIPAQSAPPHQWYNSYDPGIHHFGSTRPNFGDIFGELTHSQQLGIQALGTIILGTWAADPINGQYLPTLNLIRAPVGNVNLNNKKITLLADAVDPQDAVNLRILQQISDRNPKEVAKCATTTNNLLVGLTPAVDGVSLIAGDRVLVKNQSIRPFENGVYIASTGAWTRSSDCDTGAELVLATVFVLNGTINAGTKWEQTTPAPIRLGIDPIAWIEIESSSATNINAGAGLERVGNTISAVGTAGRISIGTGIDISTSYAGQATIVTLGTITSGVWHGTLISPQYGGTGVNNASKTITLVGNLATALTGGAVEGTPVTFELSGSTTVVLPVTGTLATLGGVETFTNKHINASQIDSGAVAIAYGGTGANAAQDAANNILPVQNPVDAGKALRTDGFGNLYWG